MKTIEIKTPDGKTLELSAPDGASSDDIHGAVQKAVAHYQQTLAPQPGAADAAAQASDPMTMIKSAAPSNVLGAAGVAAANAPGITSMLVNSLPGIGNPAAIMPAAQNIAQNPGQGMQGARRVIETQGGAQMTPDEQTQSRMGQVAGSAMEAALPGEMVANKIENNAATKAAQATRQEIPSPGVVLEHTPPPAKTLALPEPTPRSPELAKVTGEAAKKLDKSINYLTDKAKAQYTLAQKVFGLKNSQETLKVRKVDELKDALDTVMASKNPGTRSLGRDVATGIEKTENIPATTRRDQLKDLWQIDKELSQNINYNDPASQQGIFGLQKQVRAEIEKLPGGKKLAEMRKNYSDMKALQDELGPALQDPAKQAVILEKIGKGGIKGSLSEANAARAAAIAKLEKATGSDILSSVKAEHQQKALYDSALARKAEAEKLFQNETRKEAYKQAMEQRDGEKALKALKREQEVQELADAKLKARQLRDNPEPTTGKQKMVAALKHLAKHYATYAVGGGAAGAGYALFK